MVDKAVEVVPAASQNVAQGGLLQPASFQTVEGISIDELTEAGGLESIFRGESPTGANSVRINNRVINMLEIAGVHQVSLKVTLAEVVRDGGRSLVSNLAVGDGAGQAGSSLLDFATTSTGIGEFTFSTNYFFLQLEALKRLGMARSLAEPNLTALNGQPATFFVGGEFPIQEATSTVATVNQNIRYVPFGVQLAVMPTVTDGDRIRLQMMATVSERAGQGGFGNQGNAGNQNQNNDPARPPSLTSRSFRTTVELRDTESLAIAGLIRTSLTNSSQRVPFFGDVPVVGNLFSRNSTSYAEQELIMVVTPHLVSGVPLGRERPLPGSDTFEPSDLEFFLWGSLQGHIPEDYRTPVRSDLEKMKAHRAAEQKYILGLPGHSTRRPCPAPTDKP
jgi:pilus assembly protein CpaC